MNSPSFSSFYNPIATSQYHHIAPSTHNHNAPSSTDVSQTIPTTSTTSVPSFQIPVATPQIVHDNSWYMYSGVSNHMTVDTSKMTHKSSYSGGSTVQVGNGDSIPISHTSMLLILFFFIHIGLFNLRIYFVFQKLLKIC